MKPLGTDAVATGELILAPFALIIQLIKAQL